MASGDVHYYQGLHDIGAALILTVGERLAFPLLCKIATCQLRDCTRPTLDAVTELLRLINPIVEMADREIARLLEVLVGYTPCLESNFNRLSVLAKSKTNAHINIEVLTICFNYIRVPSVLYGV